MLCSDVVDKLLDEHRLSYSGTSEESDFSTLLVWAEQIYNLYSCLKHLLRCSLLLKARRRSVDCPFLLCLWRLILIDRLSEHIEHSSKCILPHRHRNRCSCCDSIHAADETISRSHGDTSDCIVAQMLCNLNDQLSAVFQRHLDCIVYLRQITL